jgi:allantoinase
MTATLTTTSCPIGSTIRAGRILIIPHTLDDNDTRLARGLGWGQAEDFFVSLRDNFDALHREGEQTPKMMTVALHCRLAGKPARAAAFARFVDHVLRHDRV